MYTFILSTGSAYLFCPIELEISPIGLEISPNRTAKYGQKWLICYNVSIIIYTHARR